MKRDKKLTPAELTEARQRFEELKDLIGTNTVATGWTVELPSFPSVAHIHSPQSDQDVVKVVSNLKLTVEKKLRQISVIDARYTGWTAVRLAELLGCTERQIRNTEWWQRRQRARKLDD